MREYTTNLIIGAMSPDYTMTLRIRPMTTTTTTTTTEVKAVEPIASNALSGIPALRAQVDEWRAEVNRLSELLRQAHAQFGAAKAHLDADLLLVDVLYGEGTE